jgi:hypothetical protein
MLDRTDKANLQIVLCSNDADAQHFKAAGVRSVRVVSDPEQLYRPTRDGYEIDATLDVFDRVVLAMPSGQEELRDELAARLGDERCRWVSWPDGFHGADEVIALRGPEGLANCLVANARPMWTDEICTLSDVPDNGEVKTFESGFSLIDGHGFRIVRPAFMPIIGPYGPLPGSAQFHTRDGWKRLDQWTDGDEALVYDLESGATKYEVVGRVVAPADNGFLHLKNGGTGEITACETHRWPVVGKLGAKRVMTTAQLADAGSGEHGSGYSLIRTFTPPENPDLPLSDDEIRLQVAICADGSIRRNMVNRRITICVRKERKKERLVRLLTALGKDYRVREYPQRPTETSFDFDGNEDKRLAQFRNASARQLRIVFDELQHWDGHVYDESRLVLSTSEPEDAEFCEYLFSACGYRASVFVQNGSPETQRDNILVCANNKGALTRAKWSTVERVPSEDGLKYCLTTSTGFFVCRLGPGQVYVTGNSGKSVLARQLLCNLWRLHGWRSLITSFEEKIKPRYQRDLRRHLIGLPMRMWDEAMVANADAQIEQGFRFLRRKRNTLLDMDRLLDRIAYAVKVYGVDVVCIDPVNEIDHQVPRGESKTDYMGRFIMRLKQLADDFNLLMIVVGHPPKDGVAKRRTSALLTLNDAADTAHYGNKADIGWCVWRDFEGPSLLHIDKLKDHESMGSPTLVELTLDLELNAFSATRIGYEILGESL